MADQSPLAEANEDSLTELFARDPLQLGEQDIQRIVEELRRKRTQWAQAEAQGKTRAPRGTKAPKASGESIASLDDLGL